MQAHHTPPAPPPMTPASGNQNPYDFILKNDQAPKRSLLSGNSQKQRIILVVLGLLILLTIGAVVAALLSSAGKTDAELFRSVANQQQEIIRVAELGSKKAKSASLKNLASITKNSVTSDQVVLLATAQNEGVKVNSKELAQSKNSETDELLADAEQANRFDEEFLKVISAQLTEYQKSLKQVIDASTRQSTKQVLSKQFQNAGNLIGTTVSVQ